MQVMRMRISFVDAAPKERKSLAQARKPWVSWTNEESAVGVAQNRSRAPAAQGRIDFSCLGLTEIMP
jgi:hypothetical protein